jgi:hypothetical protein
MWYETDVSVLTIAPLFKGQGIFAYVGYTISFKIPKTSVFTTVSMKATGI